MAGVSLQSDYGWIGFSAEVAVVITETQGIYCMEELDILTDRDIDNLCKVIRRPGGINPITNVADLGLQVPLRAKNNLKLSRIFLKHKTRTLRVAVPTDTTLNSVHILRKLKESENEHTDPLVSLVIDANNWLKTWRV